MKIVVAYILMVGAVFLSIVTEKNSVFASRLMLLILIAIVIFIFEKSITANYDNKIKKLLENIKNQKYDDSIYGSVNEIYKDIINRNCFKDDLIGKVKEESENYKNELSSTYKNLLAKTTELEYINAILEKRIAKLSNLNAVGKAVLSELDMEKIISTILDSYFVLTGAKKTALYLWNKGVLEETAVKGSISHLKKSSDNSNIRGESDSEHYSSYLEIAKTLRSLGEGVIISELKAKGKELGVIFIIEDLNEKIGPDEMEMINALSIHVSIAINNARIYNEISEKERIDKELAIASQIQTNLLPREIRSVFGLDIANYFEPAREIGGDYYDYFISAEGSFGVAIGDVSGKGMPAALLMTTLRAVLRTISFYDYLPNTVLTKLNKILFQDIGEEMFVTLFFARYDFETSKMYFSNAGHNPILYYNAENDEIAEETVKGAAIGFREDYNYRIKEIELHHGDIIVFYTDGITEAENWDKEMFGVERLKNIVMESKELPVGKIKTRILEEVTKFRENYVQVDDMTLVVIKAKR